PTLGPRQFLSVIGDPSFGDWNISWPLNFSGYILESSHSLGPNAVWTEYPTVNNEASFGTYETEYPIRYFRLRKVTP
ncbi:MAG: hypothetical protein DME25_21320, partial [Verrucomicrobia bacterium]